MHTPTQYKTRIEMQILLSLLHLLGPYGMEFCKHTSLLAHTLSLGIVQGTIHSPYQLITVAGFASSIVWMAFTQFPQYHLVVFEAWSIFNSISQLHLPFHYQKYGF